MCTLGLIGHMGLFVYIQKGSIISMVDLPTTEIIEPELIRNAGLFSSVFLIIITLKTDIIV